MNAALHNAKGYRAMTLIEALQNIDIQLAPGRVYNFEVDGYQIELRVRETQKPQREPLDLEADTMLDAWVEFPIKAEKILKSHRIEGPLWPDPPDIPADDETP